MYTTCCLMVIYPCAKFGILMTKIKYDLAQKQIHSEKIILIEAIGQGHTEVVNVFYTSSYGDTLVCQIWYYYVKSTKKLLAIHESAKTDGHTVILLYLPELHSIKICERMSMW